MAKRILTPKAVLSYPALFEAKPVMKGSKILKYSCVLVFPAGSDLTEMNSEVMEVLRAEFGDETDSLLRKNKLKMPFRLDDDEDERDRKYRAYPGCTFITVKSDTQPGIVGPDSKPIADPKALYPGAFVRARIIAFAYDTNGNKGASFALGNLQKMSDGTRIDGRKSAEEEFDVIDAPPGDLE